ncbi:hypothetical protein CONCODRAFT_77133, partial [Conidiobolus coronatus NRRL 28638]
MNSRFIRLAPVVRAPLRSQLKNFKVSCNIFVRLLTINTSLNSNNGRSTPYSLDWNCPKCDHTNFARRVECQKCGEARSKASLYQNSPQPKLRGDWFCKHCNFHNFASRKVCNSCQVPKTDDASIEVTKSQHANDWICSNCEYQNFNKRSNCRKCGHLKNEA